MPELISNNAAVISSPKAAALYFDRIFPLPGRPEHIVETTDLLTNPRADTVVLESVSGCAEIVGHVQRAIATLSEEELRERVRRTGGPRFSTAAEQMMYNASCQCNIVGSMELVLSEIPEGESPEAPRASGRKTGGALVKLLNLGLVDASQASWDQIIEFRRDEAARLAFIRMREFLFRPNSPDAEMSLADRLALQMQEYQLASRKHGFEPVAAAIDVLLNSQNLMKCVAAGILSSAAVGSASAVAVAGTCLGFDCARAVLTGRRKLFDSEEAMTKHPANWVFLARNALTPGNPVPEPGLLTRLWRRMSR